MNGNGSFQFKAYEFYQTFHIKTLVVAIVAAAGVWAMTYVVPAMQAEGGYWAMAAGPAVLAIQAVVQWATDNSGKVS